MDVKKTDVSVEIVEKMFLCEQHEFEGVAVVAGNIRDHGVL